MEKLGRYEIVRHWARGGMAEVLLARTTGIGGFERYVIVKRIQGDNAKDERFVRMFLDEARLSAMLHHGNIVQVHEVGEEEGRIFFAMEYVHGEDLRRLLRNLNVAKAKPPLEQVVAIVSATADALHHAHEQRGSDGKPLGLVHRDVTPANIIIGYDGIVKVVDFGIAKAALRSTETAGGTLKGKVAYMAPEQCMGKPVDRRSDVYALGVVLYEAVCVRRLFKGENDFLTMSSIIAGKIPPPTTYRPDLPTALEQIIMKALATRPEDRFQTAAEMGAELEQFAVSAGLRPSPKKLAAYLKERFGTRPEPWLVEGEPDATLTADFDGSGNGLVTPPLQALENLAIPQEQEAAPSAPILKARKNALPVKGHPLPAAKRYNPPPRAKSQPVVPAPTSSAATAPATPATSAMAYANPEASAPPPAHLASGWGPTDRQRTPSQMPIAFAGGSEAIASDEPPIVPVPRRRGRWPAWFPRAVPAWVPRTLPVWLRTRRARIAAGSAAMLLLFIFIFALTRSGTRTSSAAPAREPLKPATVAAPPDPVADTAAPATDPRAPDEPKQEAAKPAAHAGKTAPSHAKSSPSPAASTSPTTKKKRPKPKFLF